MLRGKGKKRIDVCQVHVVIPTMNVIIMHYENILIKIKDQKKKLLKHLTALK